jgi:pimeloyl-ACP methyl ester carboxylesterase
MVAVVEPGAAFHRGGHGSPLVLLHGLTGTWRVWSPVLEKLEAKHEVVAATLAGHRGADALAAGVTVSVASLADSIEQQLDRMGVGRAHLAGNSLGGWLAIELARRGRARSVVALSPAGGWRNSGDLLRVTRLIATGARMGIATRAYTEPLLRRPRGRRLALRSTMERGDRVPYDELVTMLDDLAGCTVLKEFLIATKRDGPFTGDGTPVSCPVRIAWGQKDRTIPFERYGRPLVEQLPGAELVMLPGVGHVPMYDDPELVARTILQVTSAVDERGGR